MGRLLKLIFQLIGLVIVLFALTAAWVIMDGTTDLGEKADVALVTNSSDASAGTVPKPLLDRAAKLFEDGEFPFIIVSGSTSKSFDQPAEMLKYLVEKGVPENVIIRLGSKVADTQEVAEQTAALMKDHGFNSVMIITDYYHVTRTKLVLNHDGIVHVQKAHVGKLQQQDAWEIGREVAAIYDYVGRMYVMPAAQKLTQEAKVDADKAKVDAEAARKKVDKGLDTMSK